MPITTACDPATVNCSPIWLVANYTSGHFVKSILCYCWLHRVQLCRCATDHRWPILSLSVMHSTVPPFHSPLFYSNYVFLDQFTSNSIQWKWVVRLIWLDSIFWCCCAATGDWATGDTKSENQKRPTRLGFNYCSFGFCVGHERTQWTVRFFIWLVGPPWNPDFMKHVMPISLWTFPDNRQQTQKRNEFLSTRQKYQLFYSHSVLQTASRPERAMALPEIQNGQLNEIWVCSMHCCLVLNFDHAEISDRWRCFRNENVNVCLIQCRSFGGCFFLRRMTDMFPSSQPSFRTGSSHFTVAPP